MSEQNHQRLAVCLIAGQGAKDDPTDLNRCLASLPDGSTVYITYTGSGSYPDINRTDQNICIHQSKFKWCDDFAAARNYNFSQVDRDRFDWILWLDTDDTLEGDSLQNLLASLDSETQGVFLRYDYAVDPVTETVLAVQWRERLFRTDVATLWHYPIHEICHTPPGTQYARKEGVYIRHWRDPKLYSPETRERNRKILAKARRDFPDEPRFEYYFANEVYAEAALKNQNGETDQELIGAAIQAYESFLPKAPSIDDAYIAAHQIGELHRMNRAFLPAIEAEAQALLIHPTWPDAYVGIAQSYMELGDWDKCEFWSQAALKNTTTQETSQVREPLNDEYMPRLLLGIAHENKGELQAALLEYEKLAEYELSEFVDDKINKVVEKINESGTNRNRNELEKEWLKDERKKHFGSNFQKSIAFFTTTLFEPWHPDIVKEGGIGGAETCVIEVAKRFKEDGWRTVVFGTPGEHKGIGADGIEWWETDDFRPTEPFSVFVSSRSAQVYDSNINAALKLLWMHDVNVGEEFSGPFGDRLPNIDKVIGLTNWHCNHLHRLYDIPVEKLGKIPNGIDLSRFTGEVERQDKKFAWSSSPDRGIDIVLQLWPSIRKRWPHAELHVFYGWHSINKILEIWPEHPLKNFKASVENMIDLLGREEGGIFWHDRVNQKELAQNLMTCDAWLYPTYFMETFCITSLEMCAAGVIPITASRAALKETNPCPKANGWPNNVTFTKEYLDLAEDLYSMESHVELREQLKDFASEFSWDKAYNNYWKPLAESVIS